MLQERARARLAWDGFVAILIVISTASIPYFLVFPEESGHLPRALYWIDLLLLCDIGINFFTTFYRHGIEIDDRAAVRMHYARNMLGVDLAANIPFDLVALLLFGTAAVEVAGMLTLLRLLRVIRLFVIFARWESIQWSAPGLVRLGKYVTVIGLAIHGLTCAWIAVGHAGAAAGDSWMLRTTVLEKLPPEQYVRALYWTVTTMTTVGYGDITPSGTREYAFAIVVMLAGASLYAFLVGGVASLLASLNATRNLYRERMQSLGGYLRSQKVSPELTLRAMKHMEYMWGRHRGINEEALLQQLPVGMQIEIKTELASEILRTVPLFQHLDTVVRNELLNAMTVETCDPGSIVAAAGEAGQKIVFVVAGTLEVVKDGSVIAEFGPGEYFGYLSMILKERRSATVVARTFCDLMFLDEADYDGLKTIYPEILEAMKNAAAANTLKMEMLISNGVVL